MSINYPIINYKHNIKNELIQNLKKIDRMTFFFNKKGTLQKKEEIIKWKFNRHIQDSLYYLYLFRKYKNSCPIPVISYNKNIDVFNIPFSYDLKLNLITVDILNKQALLNYNNYLIDNCRLIISCLEKKDLVILPVYLNFTLNDISISNHANLLIFRKINKIIEIFEPHGNSYKGKEGSNTNINLAYEKFVMFFNQELKEEPYNLIKSNIVCPYKYGLQGIERIASKFKDIDIEGGGYCVIWCVFICEMILINPYLTTKTIIKYLLDNIYNKYNKDTIGIYVLNIARGYASYFVDTLEKYYKAIFGDVYNLMEIGIKITTKENMLLLYYFECYLWIENIIVNNPDFNYIKLIQFVKQNQEFIGVRKKIILKLLYRLIEIQNNKQPKYLTGSSLKKNKKKIKKYNTKKIKI